MHRTHNEYGQALAPWLLRREVADALRAMRLRIGEDSEASHEVLMQQQRAHILESSAEMVDIDATVPLTAVDTRTELDVIILPDRGGDQMDGVGSATREQDPPAAFETAVSAGQRRTTRSASTSANKEVADRQLKRQRVDSVTVTRQSGAFYNSAVLVVHKALPCFCSDCSGKEAQLKQLEAWCGRLQLLKHKQNSSNKSALAFLQERSTFVLVHEQASIGDLISFLTLESAKQLKGIKLLTFDSVSDSAAANQLLLDDRYKWTAKPPPAVQSNTPSAAAAEATTKAATAVASAALGAKKPAQGAGLGINLHQKPLGRRKSAAVAGAVGDGDGLKGKEEAAGKDVVAAGVKVVMAGVKEVLVIQDDEDEDDELFGGERDDNGWRRRYSSSADSSASSSSSSSEEDDDDKHASGDEREKKTTKNKDKGKSKNTGGSSDRDGSMNSTELAQGAEEAASQIQNVSVQQKTSSPPLKNPDVRNKFLVGKARGQGKELTAAEIDAGGGAGRGIGKLNHALICVLKDAEEAYKASREQKNDMFRARAYAVAHAAVARVTVELTLDNYKEELGKAVGRKRGGGCVIGERVLKKVEEFLESGAVQKLSALARDPNARAMKELQEVWGIGPAMAEKLVRHGVTGVKDLVGKAQVGDLKLLPQIQTGVMHHADIMQKIPRAEIGEIAQEFLREARQVGGPNVLLTVCGSYRRGKACSGDIDCLVTVKDCHNENYSAEVVLKLMQQMKLLYRDRIKDLMHPSDKCFSFQRKDAQKIHRGCCTWMGLIQRQEGAPWRRFDVKAYPWKCYPYALLHMTGSDHFNRSMRKFAWLKGLSLSDHGLKHVERVKKDGKWVKVELGTVEYPAKSEKEVFELLHLEYVAPEDRHSGYTASML